MIIIRFVWWILVVNTEYYATWKQNSNKGRVRASKPIVQGLKLLSLNFYCNLVEDDCCNFFMEPVFESWGLYFFIIFFSKKKNVNAYILILYIFSKSKVTCSIFFNLNDTFFLNSYNVFLIILIRICPFWYCWCYLQFK